MIQQWIETNHLRRAASTSRSLSSLCRIKHALSAARRLNISRIFQHMIFPMELQIERGKKSLSNTKEAESKQQAAVGQVEDGDTATN
jgi:hypothetical protein